MMEPVSTPTMHITESKAICSALCNKTDNDEISKKLEDELLYGADDDGDEEDALSDDSLRLRLSDDDVDGDDSTAPSCPVNKVSETVKTESRETESDVDTWSKTQKSVTNKNMNKPNLMINFADDSSVINCNFCNTGAESKFTSGKPLNEFPSHNNSKHSISGNALSTFSSDNHISSAYGYAYYNNRHNFGEKKSRNGNYSNRKHSILNFPTEMKCFERSSVKCEAIPTTTENDVSASITSDTEASLNGIENIDSPNQDDESHSENNNLTKTDFKSDIRAKSKSPIEDPSLTANSAESDDKNGIKAEVKNEEDEDLKDVNIDTKGEEKSNENTDVSDVNIQKKKEEDEKTENPEKKKKEEKDFLVDENAQDVQKNDDEDDHGDVDDNDDDKETLVSSEDLKPDVVMDDSVSLQHSPVTGDGLENEDVETVVDEEDVKEDRGIEQTDNITKPELKEDKTSTKRPLSDSEAESNVCKIPCQKIQPSDSKTIGDDVKISDATEETTSESSKDAKVDNEIVTIDNMNGDSCPGGTDVENSTLPIDTTVEDESKKDENPEKPELDRSQRSKSSKRKRKRKRASSPNNTTPVTVQEKENVRQKRETAQKAEEMIRKLNNDSDSDTEESMNKVSYNYTKPIKTNAQPLSPPSLKRNSLEGDESLDSIMSKKPKSDGVTTKYTDTIESVIFTNKNKTALEYVRKFFLRDSKHKLQRLTQEQLEEMLIQKVIETITMRDEIGKLREQARISERNQEATRLKCQQLAKQIKDFEMVLTRFGSDRRNNEKIATPIKINRSVGLQVSFVTDTGIQNLRQIQNVKVSTLPNGVSTPRHNEESLNNPASGRKGIKVRSPRRPDGTLASPASAATVSLANVPISIHGTVSTVSQPPVTLVVSKPVERQMITTAAPQIITQALANNQAITLNGVQLQTNTNRQTKVLNVRSNNTNNTNTNANNNNNNNNNNNSSSSNNENLIDLTDEEEKNKLVSVEPPPLSAITLQPKDSPTIPKTMRPYQRIIPHTPGNVTIPQSAIRVIQPAADKPTPTALVNNMNTQRVFLMKPGCVQSQLVIANPNQIRPIINTAPRPAFSTITTYPSVQTISNGPVRVVAASTVPPAQKPKHPAALPAVANYPINPSLKLPPPAPSLKISKVINGIVLSWNMALSDRYAEIASYQLYAYQEVAGMAPSTTMWRKVGDVRALALPMACTLTQFAERNNYYFAVRAVDRHSRLGQYSQPGSISL